MAADRISIGQMRPLGKCRPVEPLWTRFPLVLLPLDRRCRSLALIPKTPVSPRSTILLNSLINKSGTASSKSNSRGLKGAMRSVMVEKEGQAQEQAIKAKGTNNNSACVNIVMPLSSRGAPVTLWGHPLPSDNPKAPYLWTVFHKRMRKLNKMLYAALNVSAEMRCERVGMSRDEDCKWMMSSFQFGAEI